MVISRNASSPLCHSLYLYIVNIARLLHKSNYVLSRIAFDITYLFSRFIQSLYVEIPSSKSTYICIDLDQIKHREMAKVSINY